MRWIFASFLILSVLTCLIGAGTSHGSPEEYHRLIDCMEDYVDDFRNMFGPKRSLSVRMRLLEMMTMHLRHYREDSKVVFGIGPKDSGTRSLYLALMQLNVSSRYSWHESHNCATLKASDRPSAFSILKDNDQPRSFFLAGHPVPVSWWQYFFQFPDAKFIMTDMNETLWREGILRDSCGKQVSSSWDECTAPVPFSLPYDSTMQERDKMLIYKDIYESIHLQRLSAEQNGRLFAMYRRFVRCVIPDERLLWLTMDKLPDSRGFWKQLIRFTGVDFTKKGLEVMVQAGVPHLDARGDCKFDSTPCREEQRDGHHYVYPSVCYNVTS